MTSTRADTPRRMHDQGRPAGDTDGMAESAGILYRVSSDGQDEANQVPELEAYCYEHGYRVNRHYELHDKSAYHGEHEHDLAGILEDIRTGVITVVVVVHSSRIDRRDMDIAEYFHLSIRGAGGRIESVREPMFGKSDIAGRVITMLAQHANHDYSKALSGHVRAGHDRVRREGGMFGRAPFGFEIQGDKYRKTFVPTPLGTKYVPEIFSRVIGGESLGSIAAWLNREGVPTATKVGRDKNHLAVPGKLPTWTAATVSKIIKNSVYKGQARDSERRFARECEAIVNAATWRRANERLDNAPTKRGPLRAEGLAMLSGVLSCECGSPMYRVKTGAKLPYYRCAGKVTGSSCRMIRLDTVDSAVSRLLGGNPRPVVKMTLVPGKNYDDELDLNMAQIRSLDVDDPDYAGKHAALMAERARLRNLDTTPDKWEPRPTGQTWGGLWDALSPADRGPWLQSQGFIVTAAKTAVTVSQGEVSATIAL